MTKAELEVHLEKGLESLRREFAGTIETERIVETGWERFECLYREARITDFIPLLVYRQIRDELLVCGADDVHNAV